MPWGIDGRWLKKKQWKKQVKERDNYTCQHCFGKNNNEKLCMYRIKSKNKHPELMYNVDNTITLCSICIGRCHKTGNLWSEKAKKKLSKSLVLYFKDPKIRKSLSEQFKKRWEDTEYRKKSIQAILSSYGKSPNKQEIKLMNILNKLYPDEWKFVGDGQVIINGKNPDFININGQKKIIEFYGEHWHKKEDVEKRKKTFKPFGYDTLVIWQSELKKKPELVEYKIHKFIKN
jgi:very-short-patch-repair endonuclease